MLWDQKGFSAEYLMMNYIERMKGLVGGKEEDEYVLEWSAKYCCRYQAATHSLPKWRLSCLCLFHLLIG